ncbi:MAG: dihydrolipoyl dehydrogenase [Deltaproteobacteria bacterium]|nr:dihydrolipoyl dehydrogenase [Deltaproteobacteria bacterium]
MGLTLGIIGAGPGGYVAAIRAAQLGARVVVVEQEAVGGTCLNWGCIPTKTIKATAEAIEQLHRAQELGLDLEGGFRPNLERIMARKNAVIAIQAQGILNILKSYQIEYWEGTGRVLDPQKLRVTGSAGESRDLPVDRLIIASGSKPLVFPAFPFDGQNILSSNDALVLQEIPESILIIGGGVIGCEFAFIFQALGSRVTVVEALPRVIGLPSVDEDCSKILQREMKKKKIALYLDKTVEKTEVREGLVKVTIGPSPFLSEVKEKDKKPLELEVQKVLVSIGRQSNADGLGLKELGLEVDARGWIAANDKLETNIPGIFAIGDALGPAKIMLAHVASTEGIVAAENIMGRERRMNYAAVPAGIFTFPEVATVGLTEPQAREKGLEVQADSFLFRGLGKSQAMGEIAGQVKIVSDSRNGKVLGVHIIGPHATDLIAEGTLAVHLGATVQDLAHTIHAHPTLAEAVMEAAHKAVGAGLHSVKV